MGMHEWHTACVWRKSEGKFITAHMLKWAGKGKQSPGIIMKKFGICHNLLNTDF